MNLSFNIINFGGFNVTQPASSLPLLLPLSFCGSYEFVTGAHAHAHTHFLSKRKRPRDRQSLVWMPLWMTLISQRHPPPSLSTQPDTQLGPPKEGGGTRGMGSALPKGITSLHSSVSSAPLSVHCTSLSLRLSFTLIYTYCGSFFFFSFSNLSSSVNL